MSRGEGRAWRTVAEIVLVGVVLGAAAGVVWWLAAPDLRGQLTDAGVLVPVAEASKRFGMVAWFAVVTAAGGLLHGVVALGRHRERPVLTLLVLFAGGLLASVIAWLLGAALSEGGSAGASAEAGAGATVGAPLELGAPAAMLLWPIAAMVGAVAVAALTPDANDSRR